MEVVHWLLKDSSPYRDIMEFSTMGQEESGWRPNVLSMGHELYSSFLNHPDTADRIKYGYPKGSLANVFGLDVVEVNDNLAPEEGILYCDSKLLKRKVQIKFCLSDKGNVNENDTHKRKRRKRTFENGI